MTQDYFKNRHTIRRYDGRREVTDDLIREITEEAMHAPTTGNMQLYSVIITRSEEGKRRLSPAHFGQPQVASAAVVLTFCADFRRFVNWCRASGADPGYDNFQSFMTAVLDTALFAQQFCTIAEMRGLGTCYLGTTTYNAPQIAEALDLPEMVVPVTTLTVGWPAAPGEECGRLPVGAVLHHEKYNDRNDEQIKELYAEKEAREDSRRFVAENGKESLAQVFTDVRYPRSNNELFSEIYLEFIRKQGFKL